MPGYKLLRLNPPCGFLSTLEPTKMICVLVIALALGITLGIVIFKLGDK